MSPAVVRCPRPDPGSDESLSRAPPQVTLVTAILSFINPYTHIGGGELVLLLFSECKPDAPSHLCVSHPSEIGGVMLAIAVAMVLKSALTVITFGIKLAAGTRRLPCAPCHDRR